MHTDRSYQTLKLTVADPLKIYAYFKMYDFNRFKPNDLPTLSVACADPGFLPGGGGGRGVQARPPENCSLTLYFFEGGGGVSPQLV